MNGRMFLAMVLLGSCAEPGDLQTHKEPVAQPMGMWDGARRTALTLVDLSPTTWWGDQVEYEVSGTAPGETVHLLRSTAGAGPGPCPDEVGGQCLSIRSPVKLLDSQPSDAAGVAQFAFTLPDPGPTAILEVGLQAAAVRGLDGIDSVLSNPLTSVFQIDPANLVQETFAHQRALIDVLFIIDNSCSMGYEQFALEDYSPDIVDLFTQNDIDWHLGAISTDMLDPTHQGRLRDDGVYRWIDENTPDPQTVFSAMVLLGTTGHYDEEGFAAAMAAHDTHGSGYNAGFFRPDAQLSMVVLSDENDFSPVTPTDFANWMTQLRPTPTELSFNSIVGPIPLCETAVSVSPDYLEVTALVGGVEWSICDVRYDRAMRRAAARWWTSQPMVLAQPVNPATLSVTAREPTQPDRLLSTSEWGYEASANSVRLRTPYAPPAGTELIIAYEP